jgi:integrase
MATDHQRVDDAFMAELRAHDSVSARSLEFTILTAARTAEVIEARWDEIDFDAKVWNVPGVRTKSGRGHRVPLSGRVLAILSELPRLDGEAGYIFPGAREGKPLSNMAMLELLRGMRPGVTVHGMRSTFKDWCAEQTNYPNEVSEAALGHVVGDKVEAAYRRGDALAKRRRLMQHWADYCRTQVGKGGEVVPLRA